MDLPRVDLAHLPTPLHPLPRLAEAVGLNQLWVKRDDCTGLALGGNKVRQLEFLLGDALAKGADLIVAHGYPQSNFTRLTAAAACKLGLKSVLLIQGESTDRPQGNLLLDEWFGAELRFLPDLTPETYAQASFRLHREFKSTGYTPCLLPLGGGSPLGAVGYALAMQELADQARTGGIEVDAIVVAAGSGGTLAGMLIGARRHFPNARIYGMSVGPRAEEILGRCRRLASSAARLLRIEWNENDGTRLVVVDEWAGPTYGVASASGEEALRLAARMEGLLLDPVYTAKAFAALSGLVRRGEIQRDARVVFWHTGGVPTLFASEPPSRSGRT